MLPKKSRCKEKVCWPVRIYHALKNLNLGEGSEGKCCHHQEHIRRVETYLILYVFIISIVSFAFKWSLRPGPSRPSLTLVCEEDVLVVMTFWQLSVRQGLSSATWAPSSPHHRKFPLRSEAFSSYLCISSTWHSSVTWEVVSTCVIRCVNGLLIHLE